jgi:hypothetical protein
MLDIGADHLQDMFWYLGPIIECTNCQFSIALPYRVLPQTDSEQLQTKPKIDLLEWPSGEFEELIGCPRCGHTMNYYWSDVEPEIFPQRIQGVYHDDATLYRVQVSCANVGCKVPSTIYASTLGRDGGELRRKLASGFFRGQLDCEHEIPRVPANVCRIERVTTRLW